MAVVRRRALRTTRLYQRQFTTRKTYERVRCDSRVKHVTSIVSACARDKSTLLLQFFIVFVSMSEEKEVSKDQVECFCNGDIHVQNRTTELPNISI